MTDLIFDGAFFCLQHFGGDVCLAILGVHCIGQFEHGLVMCRGEKEPGQYFNTVLIRTIRSYQIQSLKDAGPIEYLYGLQNLTTVATFVYQILSPQGCGLLNDGTRVGQGEGNRVERRDPGRE